MTTAPATTYVSTGAYGTIIQPWPGDTYTILDTATGAIVGWVVWHSGTWRAVSLGSVTPDLRAANTVLDSISPSIRRDGHASLHAAWMTVENGWVGR